MEKVKVNVRKEKNWAGNEYLLYEAEGIGKVVELDYPIKELGRKQPRVYCLDKERNVFVCGDYVQFSSVPQALVGAETACKGYLLNRGYEVSEIVYPRTIKMR